MVAKSKIRAKPAAAKAPARRRDAPRAHEPPTSPEHFINRQLSWLEFNARVLNEGLNRDNPLLERLNFLSIVSSNFDEFFMVRVARLKRLARDRDPQRCPAGLSAPEQLAAIAERVHGIVDAQYRGLQEILPLLAHHGVVFVGNDALEPDEEAVVQHYFDEEIYPSTTAIAASATGATLARLANLTLHIAVRLRTKGKAEERLALVPLPRSWPRTFELKPGNRFVLLENVVKRYIDRFFSGHTIVEAAVLRITRDADLGVDDEDAEDLLSAMEEMLRARKGGPPVRLEIENGASPELTAMCCRSLGLEPQADTYRIEGPLDLKPFMALAARIDHRPLHYAPFTPQPVLAFEEDRSAWQVLRERDVLTHLPYESFDPVVKLLEEAADDPHVLAIKQTLYRTSAESPIIAALERAARRDKQVTVLVELKARFDEARNIAWARRLTDAGAHVLYGILGLKTHAKVLLIVRREADGTRRYVHLSTGNYNDIMARRYEDISLFTSRPDFGTDASNFFNALTGYSEQGEWRQLVIAPTGLRERLMELIDRETARSSKQDPGLIMLKMNSFADTEIATRLCEAARHGVRVRLCVRGICCVRPGVRGFSPNVEVRSIVDRFLEHSRIYYFRNAGNEEVYLSSADIMPRNLDRRLELMFPVRDEQNARRLIGILNTVFGDNARAWRLRSDGTYERATALRGRPVLRAQERFMEEARVSAEALRLRRLATFRPQGPGMAPGAQR